MRRIRYQVASTLDGFIAGPNGEFDWIPPEPDFDFGAHFAQFDTILVGRETYAGMKERGEGAGFPGIATYVCSRSMKPADVAEGVHLTRDAAATARELKERPGKDIWLFGGGSLFRELLLAGVVDTVELAVMPVLLGHGVPVVPALPRPVALRLTDQKVFPKSGMILMSHEVVTAKA